MRIDQRQLRYQGKEHGAFCSPAPVHLFPCSAQPITNNLILIDIAISDETTLDTYIIPMDSHIVPWISHIEIGWISHIEMGWISQKQAQAQCPCVQLTI